MPVTVSRETLAPLCINRYYQAMTQKTQLTGQIGETVAAQYLQQSGYRILAQNYQKPWVEIDIIAYKEPYLYVIEVKTVSYETKADLEWAVTHETWRPEEQVHERKRYKLGQGAEAWIEEHRYTGEWQIVVLAVRIVPRETYATVNMLPL